MMIHMLYFKIILMGVFFMLAGCTSQNNPDNEVDWDLSSTFEVGDMTLYGKEGRLGFQPHGNADISVGGHFSIYFWGKEEELADTYSLVGIHKESGARKTLYPDWEVSRSPNLAGADAGSGAKFVLDPEGNKKGKWRLEIYMGDKYFDSIFCRSVIIELNYPAMIVELGCFMGTPS